MVNVELWVLWSLISTNSQDDKGRASIERKSQGEQSYHEEARSVSGGRRRQTCGAGMSAASNAKEKADALSCPAVSCRAKAKQVPCVLCFLWETGCVLALGSQTWAAFLAGSRGGL